MEHNKDDGGVYPIITRVADGYAENFHWKSVRGSGHPEIPDHTYLKVFWRPNNYRRQLKIRIAKNSLIGNNKPHPTISNGIYKKNTQNKSIFIKDYHGITILIYKKTLIGVLPQTRIYGNKEVYEIEYQNIKQVDLWLLEKKEEIKVKIDHAINEICKELKLEKKTEILWSRYEDWFKDDLIDKIPREAIIQATAYKKVYHSGIEATYSKQNTEPIETMRRYLKNREAEEVPPPPENINKSLEIIFPLQFLKSKCKTKDDILKHKELIELLTDSQREAFTEWIFYKFSIHK